MRRIPGCLRRVPGRLEHGAGCLKPKSHSTRGTTYQHHARLFLATRQNRWGHFAIDDCSYHGKYNVDVSRRHWRNRLGPSALALTIHKYSSPSASALPSSAGAILWLGRVPCWCTLTVFPLSRSSALLNIVVGHESDISRVRPPNRQASQQSHP